MAAAYLLVSHGSRDPRPQAAVTQLAQQLNLWLNQSAPVDRHVYVGTAQLELADTPLHSQIIEFIGSCQQQADNNLLNRVIILPLFLLPGVHVMVDIPAEIFIAQSKLGAEIELVVTSFLGADDNLAEVFDRSRAQLPAQTIAISHGSRRQHGNQPIEKLAASLDVEIAYWSIEPSLADRVANLVELGATEIGILPYFLFAGGITTAIATSVAELSQQFPQTRLILGDPIGNSPELIKAIGKIFAQLESSN